ncbi:MAG: hypothetical protein ICV60_20820 [Pyrinomonadaceae bacterium]|nr:hypothetical protein [Pyrinomonadaceae bacterium]
MIEDNSLEFDMFEDVRRKLVEFYQREGRERLEAEKIALYLVQGIRETPKLIAMIAEADSHTSKEINDCITSVLENATALEKARAVLLGLEEQNG